jgi:hypothetical protein
MPINCSVPDPLRPIPVLAYDRLTSRMPPNPVRSGSMSHFAFVRFFTPPQESLVLRRDWIDLSWAIGLPWSRRFETE